jgi:3-hydroxymyristoyl/3-hydroxydecanoyl-(acyl carrier protein) dehydratase
LTTTPARPAALFDHDRILAFAIGKPSEAFGEPYRVFDEERIIARLPGPPYQFLDRITEIRTEPWKMVAGGHIVAEYDVPPDAWYFVANRQEEMPFAVILEIALQPCGWLAAYLGSALTSDVDLSFRNLGGNAVLHIPVTPRSGTLATRVKITGVSSSGGMIIQNYEFSVSSASGPVYSGDTYFGFFSKVALDQQVGLRDARLHEPDAAERAAASSFSFPSGAPFPDERLRMLDRIDVLTLTGGPHGEGFVRGSKDVRPDERFIASHFYQDPVWPGSLGLEAFLQLLKVFAARRWGAEDTSRLRFATLALGQSHHWVYRGQVIPRDRHVTVEASIREIDDAQRQIRADGFLTVDGRIVYQMRDFCACLLT